MSLIDRLTGFFRKERGGNLKSDAHKNSDLQKNMEKALRMKQEAGEKPNIPAHQTPGEGMQPAQDPHMSDATRGAEAGFTPQLKRSRVARSGDT
jgi:hypothetical protein